MIVFGTTLPMLARDSWELRLPICPGSTNRDEIRLFAAVARMRLGRHRRWPGMPRIMVENIEKPDCVEGRATVVTSKYILPQHWRGRTCVNV